MAWTLPRLNALPHDGLIGGPAGNWELGTRDTGAYATMSDVVGYFDWLGGKVSGATDRRAGSRRQAQRSTTTRRP